MPVTDDQKYRLHKACLHDEDVRIAIAGFLVARFDSYGIQVDPEIFADALRDFSMAMSSPEVIEKSIALLEAIKAKRREGMH